MDPGTPANELTALLVLIGAGIMGAALRHAPFLTQHAGEHGRRWRILFALVGLFILGFLFISILIAMSPSRVGVLETFVAAMLLAGGFFVHEVIKLSATTSEHLMETAQQQRNDALHDPLTRLPNRLLFNERLAHNLQMARRTGLSLCVLVMDLDGFKGVNDELGHEAGDEVLIELAPRLRRSIRESDLVSRIGGDEFAAVLVNCEVDEAAAVAAKIADAIGQPIHVKGKSLSVGISIGIASFPLHGTDHPTLLRHADRAMYRAKRAGEPVVYTPLEAERA